MRVSKIEDKPIRKSYSKGTGHSYSIAKITKDAAEWEVELVQETEQKFAEIRKAYSHLTRLRKQCSTLIQVIK